VTRGIIWLWPSASDSTRTEVRVTAGTVLLDATSARLALAALAVGCVVAVIAVPGAEAWHGIRLRCVG
jgi:hypothetical protein